jgi:hypothetical protein
MTDQSLPEGPFLVSLSQAPAQAQPLGQAKVAIISASFFFFSFFFSSANQKSN